MCSMTAIKEKVTAHEKGCQIDSSPLLTRFAAIAECYPDSAACSDGNRTLTFKELDVISNDLAAEFLRVGDGVREPIGLYMDLSWYVLPAFLAAAKAGLPYVPLDLSWPEERMRRVLDFAGCKVLVVMPGKSVPSSISENRTLMHLDAIPKSDTILTAVPASTPLYIMFTSGTTGEPKGVVVSHANAEQFATARPFPGFEAGDRISAFISLAFDGSVGEVWGGMLNGGTVVYAEKNTSLDSRRCQAFFAEQAIDCCVLSASVFNILSGQDPAIFEGLKKVILIGEQPNSAMCARVLAAGAPAALYNAYGPTECSVWNTFEDIQNLDETRAIPAGYPMTGVTLQIVDAEGKPLPKGEWGEVLIGGPCVSLGYYNDPERTRAVFIPDPLDPSRTVYKTGDRGRIDEQGKLHLSGRFDDQVKISGVRVELGEIRLLINAAPMVLLGHALYDAEFGLIAYVVKKPGYEHLDEHRLHEELVAFLSRHLSAHSLPKHTIPVPRMPLNSNGKVHGASLPRPELSIAAASGDSSASAVLTTFRDALHNPSYTIDDAFLSRGGSSLLAARLVGDLHKLTGVWVPLELFMRPRTAKLVELYVSSAGKTLPALHEETYQEVRF